jgi:FAD/FMN-containing dehydrogenase
VKNRSFEAEVQACRPDEFLSWGRLPGARHAGVTLWSRTAPLPTAGSLLPYGRGRSYGDCCLNAGGTLLATKRLDRFIAFDPVAGTLVCEAGTTLGEIIDCCLPRGWFLAVVPGTQHVSVGGAIANDVHGKNHHRAGTFGAHVVRFELLRSDGQRLHCSLDENPDKFRATIGGLGLTGLITWVELRMRPVASALLDVEEVPFASLDEFARLSTDADQNCEYTVAWFDGCSYLDGRLRGILSSARHVEEGDATLAERRPGARLRVPFAMPGWVLGRATVRAFNALYHAAKRRHPRRRVRLEPFLFPLDVVRDWNLIYGRSGFMQLQCAFTEATGTSGVAQLLELTSRRGESSFLTVLKRFGPRPSPGMLSFPMPGITVALDFPNRPQTRSLLAECHAVVSANGGRIYCAKDAAMTPQAFAAGYPNWREFLPHVDPRFSSSFWRRTAAALM